MDIHGINIYLQKIVVFTLNHSRLKVFAGTYSFELLTPHIDAFRLKASKPVKNGEILDWEDIAHA